MNINEKKCICPEEYPNIQNHSTPTLKRCWNSSNNKFYTNNSV